MTSYLTMEMSTIGVLERYRMCLQTLYSKACAICELSTMMRMKSGGGPIRGTVRPRSEEGYPAYSGNSHPTLRGVASRVYMKT